MNFRSKDKEIMRLKTTTAAQNYAHLCWKGLLIETPKKTEMNEITPER